MDIPANAAPSVAHDRLAAAGSILLALLIVMMIVPEGFDYAMLATGRLPEAGSTLSRALWLLLLGGAIVLSASRGTLFRLTLKQTNLFLLLFAALAILSIGWSLAPIVTVRRDFRMLTIVWVCLAFTLTGWHARRFQNVVRPILTSVLIGSLAFGLFAPGLAIHQETAPELVGAWRGLTNHKNSLGALAGVTVLFWLQAWSARETRIWKALLGCAVGILCLWLSRSATALIAMLFGAAFLALLTQWPRTLQPYLKYAIVIVIVTLTLYALTMLRLIPGAGILLKPLASLTGSDLTFTGRTEIWTLVTEHISANPVFGGGYGAYWVGPDDPTSPSYVFVARMGGFYPGTAHNGYLEIANDLGWTGLLLLFGFLAQYVRQTLRLFIVDRPQAALFLTLFMQQIVSNLSESHWMSVLSVQFVLMTAATAALARHTLDVRLQLRNRRPIAPQGNAPAWRLQGRSA